MSLLWDRENLYRLHILGQGWQYLCYDWHWATDHGLGENSQHMANVAVIDGGKQWDSFPALGSEKVDRVSLLYSGWMGL